MPCHVWMEMSWWVCGVLYPMNTKSFEHAVVESFHASCFYEKYESSLMDLTDLGRHNISFCLTITELDLIDIPQSRFRVICMRSANLRIHILVVLYGASKQFSVLRICFLYKKHTCTSPAKLWIQWFSAVTSMPFFTQVIGLLETAGLLLVEEEVNKSSATGLQ